MASVRRAERLAARSAISATPRAILVWTILTAEIGVLQPIAPTIQIKGAGVADPIFVLTPADLASASALETPAGVRSQHHERARRESRSRARASGHMSARRAAYPLTLQRLANARR